VLFAQLYVGANFTNTNLAESALHVAKALGGWFRCFKILKMARELKQI
jgi:hypothetical protein